MKRLGLGVGEVDWSPTFDFVVQAAMAPPHKPRPGERAVKTKARR